MIPNNDFLRLTLDNPSHLAEQYFQLGNNTNVSVWNTGVICFEPENYGNKDIVLSCAVHGNETAPIEICNDLIANILREELVLAHRVLFIIANPPAILIDQRFVDENMNRLFSEHHAKCDVTNPERERAAYLEKVLAKFFTSGASDEQVKSGQAQRIHYDLHTAIRESKNEKFAVYPFLHERKHNRSELAFLSACGVNTILLNEAPTTTFSYFSSSSFLADAFTIELGKVRPFGENDMTRFAATKTMLGKLISEPVLDLPALDKSKIDIYRVHKVINRTKQDFRLGFADEEKNFQDFPLGFVLAIDGDVEFKVDVEGEAIVFPNANVALGQRALLTVVPTELD